MELWHSIAEIIGFMLTQSSDMSVKQKQNKKFVEAKLD